MRDIDYIKQFEKREMRQTIAYIRSAKTLTELNEVVYFMNEFPIENEDWTGFTEVELDILRKEYAIQQLKLKLDGTIKFENVYTGNVYVIKELQNNGKAKLLLVINEPNPNEINTLKELKDECKPYKKWYSMGDYTVGVNQYKQVENKNCKYKKRR